MLLNSSKTIPQTYVCVQGYSLIIIIIERFIDSVENDGHLSVYMRQVEIIKQINNYTNNNKFKNKKI